MQKIYILFQTDVFAKFYKYYNTICTFDSNNIFTFKKLNFFCYVGNNDLEY